jgi:Flp pilus assembly protein TadG
MHARNKSFIRRLMLQQSGASAAEFALVLPILTVLLFGAVDVSGLAWAKMQVGAAARAGASYALTYGFDEAGINLAVANATGLTVTAGTPTETFGCPDAAIGIAVAADDSTPCAGSGELPGNYVTVGASADYTPIFGWPGLPETIPLSAESKVRVS